MDALVLLGAGASYGSGDVMPYPPPLGNGYRGLFARLEEHSQLARRLPASLKEKFRNNFEQGMAEYYEFADGDIMAFQRHLALYLARFKPGWIKNIYRDLLRDTRVADVVFASLNYDLLLELSAHSIGIEVAYGLERLEGCIRLLKPHGSSNFWPVISGTLRRVTFSRNGGGDISAPVRPLDQATTIQRCILEDSVAPAIAIYAEGKDVRVCPEFVRHQQEQFRQAASDSPRIFISGVRVQESDTHIWGDALTKVDGDVTYFGLDGDAAAFSSWKEKSGKRNVYFIKADFAGARKIIAERLK
ncbi:MAG TPA: hypothetical protein VGH80_05615 [Xanthomonadaceae bacterium]|jgi:hypothetical protein